MIKSAPHQLDLNTLVLWPCARKYEITWPVGVNFRSYLFRTAAWSESSYQSIMVPDWMEIRYSYEKCVMSASGWTEICSLDFKKPSSLVQTAVKHTSVCYDSSLIVSSSLNRRFINTLSVTLYKMNWCRCSLLKITQIWLPEQFALYLFDVISPL